MSIEIHTTTNHFNPCSTVVAHQMAEFKPHRWCINFNQFSAPPASLPRHQDALLSIRACLISVAIFHAQSAEEQLASITLAPSPTPRCNMQMDGLAGATMRTMSATWRVCSQQASCKIFEQHDERSAQIKNGNHTPQKLWKTDVEVWHTGCTWCASKTN